MNYKLYYCPVPFRVNFIRPLLKEVDENYDEATYEEIIDLYSMPPEEQLFSCMVPPFLHALGRDIFLGQMPVNDPDASVNSITLGADT